MSKKLKESIKKLNNLIKNANIEDIDMNDILQTQEIEAIETVLRALKNSIPKEVIEKKVEEYKKHLPDKTTYEEFRNGNTYTLISKQTTYELAIKVLQELLEEQR